MMVRTIMFVGLATVALGAVGQQVFQPLANLDPPTDLEDFVFVVAINFDTPALCERISPLADGGGGGWAPRGFQIEALRSECFRKLAMRLRNASLCDQAFPVRTRGLDGSGLDKNYCLAAVNGNEGVVATPDPHNMRPFISFLNKLGYDDRQVVESRYQENPQNSPTHAAYEQLRREDGFLGRVRSATSYSEARTRTGLRPANAGEVLYQMIAVDTPDASLCAKVSPNATLVDLGKTALLQSRCYIAIAYNMRDAALCDQLPRSGSFPHVIDGYDSLEGCRTNVAVYSRPGFDNGGLTDGPLPFAHASDFADALQQIGYANAVQSRVEPEPDDYWGFVSRLAVRGNPQERNEFVRRVMSLQ